MLPLLVVLFFLSGLTGLVYEVLWTRRLTLFFGHTVLAASTVLAAFMSGLGLGSLLGGRWADRQAEGGPARFWRTYGTLEAGIGLAALASLPLLELTGQAHLALARGGVSGLALQLAILAMALAVLLPPTILMGATLPVMARGLQGMPEGRAVGGLYGINTMGACFGAALAGYVLLPYIGIKASIILAAILNLTLGWAARYSATSLPGDPLVMPASTEPGPDPRLVVPGTGLIPVVMGLAGGAAMALQVGWTRGLVLSVGSSTYAFATMLCLFLAGVGLGSLVYSLWCPRSPRVTTLAAIQLGTGILAALTSSLLGYLPYLVWLGVNVVNGSFLGTLAMQFGVSSLVLVGPAFCMGLAFPLAVELYRQGGLGSRLSVLYCVNTAGCVLGAVLAGFFLLPEWGAQVTLKLASLALLLSALMLGLRSCSSVAHRLAWLGSVSGLALVVTLLPPWNAGLMAAGVAIYGEDYRRSLLSRLAEPAWYRDGVSTTVAVFSTPGGELSMRTNGKTDASTSLADLSTMYLIGYVTALYADQPRNACVIGLGGGMTVEALAAVPSLQRIDCVELEPVVVEAQRFWEGYNSYVARDPRVNLVVADGRTFIETSPHRYDILVSEPSNVWVAGVGNLFTRDFYRSARNRLSDEGVMGQWIQNYGLGPEELGMVINSFFDVFPWGSVWLTAENESDILLIGSRKPIELSIEKVRAFTALPKVRQRLFSLGLCQSESILGHYVGDREAALKLFGRLPFNTDDRPALEFRAARQLFLSQRAHVQGVGSWLFDIQRPLPAGIKPTPEILQAAAQGWLASRAKEQLQRLWASPELGLEQLPLAAALARTGLEQLTPQRLLEIFQPALHDPRTAPLAGYLLALEMQARQGWELAAQAYEQVAERGIPPGTEAQLWENLGSCRMQVGQFDKAVRALEKAVAAGGGYSSLTLLGDAWLRLEQPERALGCFTKAVSLNQVYVPALWGQAQALIGLKRYAQAIPAYRNVLALVPSHLLALTNLAYCQTQLQDLAGAIATNRLILRFHPNNPQAQHNLLLLGSGKATPALSTPEATPSP